jgi:hypothetical protein
MQEIRTSGSMSGDGKRSVAAWPKLPRPSSTLPGRLKRSVAHILFLSSYPFGNSPGLAPRNSERGRFSQTFPDFSERSQSASSIHESAVRFFRKSWLSECRCYFQD